MTIPSEPRTPLSYHEPLGAAFPPIVALAVVAIAMASFYAFQIASPLVGLPPLVGMTLSYAVLTGVPFVAMRASGLTAEALGLRWPRMRHLVAALLVGATAWYANLLLDAWLLSDHHHDNLAPIVDESPIGPTLLVLAVLPGLCEEIVFRGVLVRSLGRVMPLVVAALASAAVFSAYHLSVIQAAPTFTLGILLGVIAQRADSAVPTMVAHILNNAIAIGLRRNALTPVVNTVSASPEVCLVLALIAVTVATDVVSWPVSASSRSRGL